MESEGLQAPEKPQYAFDAIVVLGALMKKDEETGQWKLPTIIEDDPGKLVGGHSRAIAVKQADSKNLSPLFLITGGLQADETGQKASRAEVLADLITNKYKVDSRKVKLIGKVGNTIGNAQDTVDYLRANPEIIRDKRLAILTNDWHMERAMEIFSQNPFFKEAGIELIPLAAENLLEQRSAHYKKWVIDLKSTPGMARRTRMEKRGLKALKSGKYEPLSS